MASTLGRQRGASLSVLVVGLIVSLLALIGLVVDGGAQSAATRECALVAAEAARSASDVEARHRLVAAGSSSDAVSAGEAVIAAHAPMSGDVRLQAGHVVVRTQRTVPTTFLSLFGVTTLPAHGEAEVALKMSGD